MTAMDDCPRCKEIERVEKAVKAIPTLTESATLARRIMAVHGFTYREADDYCKRRSNMVEYRAAHVWLSCAAIHGTVDLDAIAARQEANR